MRTLNSNEVASVAGGFTGLEIVLGSTLAGGMMGGLVMGAVGYSSGGAGKETVAIFNAAIGSTLGSVIGFTVGMAGICACVPHLLAATAIGAGIMWAKYS